MRLAIWQPGKIAPGETWESPESWLTPHEGGWAKGIEAYRQFVREVNPPREIPKHIREGLGYLSIWMSDQHETVPERAAIRFKDLPAIARDARDHGLDEMSVWRWCFHLRMPIPLREVLGSMTEWIQGVRKSEEIGVNIAAAVGIHLLHHRELPRYGITYTSRNAWNFHRDLIPNFNPSYLKGLPFDHAGQTVPPSNPLWQKDAVASVSEWIDRGVTSFTWDVFGGGGPDGALSSRYEDNLALVDVVKQFRARARKANRESSLAAETNSIAGLEWDGEVLDYTWNWLSNQTKEGHLTTTEYVEYVEAAPIHNVLRAPRVNCNVERSPLALKKCLADGTYINFLLRKPDGENGSAILSEKPELSPLVKQAAARRKQFLPYFAEGTPIGECILSEPSPLFVRGHVQGDKVLIVILNDRNAPVRADLTLNLALWLTPGDYRLHRYHEGGMRTATAGITVSKGLGSTLPGMDLKAGEMEFVTIERVR
ncbi:MAG: hypothetical protein ACKV22_41440 [Bryobacteraceae bacterium]